MIRLAVIITALIALSGCSSADITRFKGETPRFDFVEYFKGDTRGWGMVQNRQGMVTRRFIVDMVGSLNSSGEFLLREDFHWSDGEEEERTWTVVPRDRHHLTGTAADVVGTAEGTGYGNALHWRYHLLVDVDGSQWKIHFDDWMFLQSDNLLINTLQMSKFGFDVGRITIVFSKNYQKEQEGL